MSFYNKINRSFGKFDLYFFTPMPFGTVTWCFEIAMPGLISYSTFELTFSLIFFQRISWVKFVLTLINRRIKLLKVIYAKNNRVKV
jgi:hypothetical protein